MNYDPDYTPQDAGNSTHQVGDKFYKSEQDLIDLQKAKLADMVEDSLAGADVIF